MPLSSPQLMLMCYWLGYVSLPGVLGVATPNQQERKDQGERNVDALHVVVRMLPG